LTIQFQTYDRIQPDTTRGRRVARKAYREKNKEIISIKKNRAKATVEQYNYLLSTQNGKCAICNIDHTQLKRRIAVDHDHVTGKIRGLLCDKCNRGLGLFCDNKDFLKKAANYLTQNEIQETRDKELS
jgi:hypothetical protein